MTVHVTDHRGFIIEAVDALRTTLSQSWHVQNWLGLDANVAPETDTYNAISAFTDSPPADGERYNDSEEASRVPRVFIDTALQTAMNVRRYGPLDYMTDGSLMVYMERLLTSGEKSSVNTAVTNLVQAYGRMAEELLTASNSGGTLCWTELAVPGNGIGVLDPRDTQQAERRAVIQFEVRYGRDTRR